MEIDSKENNEERNDIAKKKCDLREIDADTDRKTNRQANRQIDKHGQRQKQRGRQKEDTARKGR